MVISVKRGGIEAISKLGTTPNTHYRMVSLVANAAGNRWAVDISRSVEIVCDLFRA